MRQKSSSGGKELKVFFSTVGLNWFRQTKCILVHVMMSKERHTKLYNRTYQAGVFVLGHGHYNKSSSENAVFILLFFSTLGHGSDKLCVK